jgi:hypothetical protein
MYLLWPVGYKSSFRQTLVAKFATLEGISSLRCTSSPSGTSIRRKRHESVISSVMGSSPKLLTASGDLVNPYNLFYA